MPNFDLDTAKKRTAIRVAFRDERYIVGAGLVDSEGNVTGTEVTLFLRWVFEVLHHSI